MAKISNFVSSLSEMVVKECHNTILINNKDMSCIIVYAQQIEEEKLKNKSRKVESGKRSDGNSSHAMSDRHGCS